MLLPSLDDIRRERARRDFRYYLDWITPEWSWHWPHLRAMQDILQAVADDEIENAMLLTPPQHGKSQQNTVRFNAWLLLRDPNATCALGAYNQEYANKLSRATRRMAVDSGLQLAKDRVAVAEWETTQGGFFKAAGIGAGLTGYNIRYGSIDDPIKDREEAESQKVRDGQWDWYTDVWLTRNMRHQVITLTPWHHDGLQARILNSPQAKRWTVLQLPALALDDDPLGRAPGEALCPERVTKEELESRRLMNPYTFEALYQCNPTPREGAIFKVSALGSVGVVPGGLSMVRAWDLAASPGRGDYTVGVLMAGPDSDGRYYIVDVVRGQYGVGERNRIIRATAEADGDAVRIVVPNDPGSAGNDSVYHLKKLLAGFAVADESQTGKKAVRAEGLAAQVDIGNVLLVKAAWNIDLIEEFRQFDRGTHDDIVDAAASAFNRLAKRPQMFVV